MSYLNVLYVYYISWLKVLQKRWKLKKMEKSIAIYLFFRNFALAL